MHQPKEQENIALAFSPLHKHILIGFVLRPQPRGEVLHMQADRVRVKHNKKNLKGQMQTSTPISQQKCVTNDRAALHASCTKRITVKSRIVQ
jgi:hypothetical protein